MENNKPTQDWKITYKYSGKLRFSKSRQTVEYYTAHESQTEMEAREKIVDELRVLAKARGLIVTDILNFERVRD